MTEESHDPQWLSFRRALEAAIGVPLGQYKEPQMKRRLASLMTRRGITSWSAFTRAIAQDPKLLDEVKDTLTINVSEFFRQPERFLELEKKWFPKLLQERRTLKIWSAGCSIGCEPYTVAMILDTIDPAGRHSILATDVDMPILSRAREGAGYLPSEVRSVPPAYLKKYFIHEQGTYRVIDEIRRRVTFRRHDLLKDPYPTDLDLILCRNVVIYFTEEAKQHIYTGFSKALRPGGVLFIGGSEMIMRSGDIGLRTAGTNLYQKAA
ncbi:protein-glutamate O-methyltransferase CheR [Tepidiforma sp.]|uniref:CheR family methyltransferase n=1 Tax=Tepidiforma sp. TaxID=2682230 RepID=UPI002ADD7F49|nr:protein-glutamate O-methyltransferase CheR [Tepidiforma sp.]